MARRTGCVVRRTLAESAFLLTAPITALPGVLWVTVTFVVGTFTTASPRLSRRCWSSAHHPGDVEWWRIRALRAAGTNTSSTERRPAASDPAADPGRWLDAAHAVIMLPVVAATWLVTATWWLAGLAFATYPIRNYPVTGPLRPLTLDADGGGSHLSLSLGLTSPGSRIAFAVTVAALVAVTLPLVTGVATAVHVRLGEALLSDESVWHRRISGLENERDVARARAAAVVSAEADALRRLERDIHDGPQQQLVRLGMELGRARYHFDRDPELVREALTEAVVHAREALDELRALSRGIAPPILADRGLPAALAELAERSVVPATLDADTDSVAPGMTVETAAYFVVAEALTNAAKHSDAHACVIGLRRHTGVVRVWVTDDGHGGAAIGKGHGLRGLADRVLAVGGTFDVDSPVGGPTTITATLPCR